jgi:hypothetical protein
MHHRLTLRVSDEALLTAKGWSEATGRSLSRLVEEVFLSLARKPAPTDDLPPITRELAGLGAGAQVDEEDWHRHLEEKYR